MSKKIIYSIFIILIGLSFLVGWQLGKISERKTLQEDIDFLKSKLEIFYPPLPDEIYGISGKVIEIEDKTILMESSVSVSQFETEKQNIKVIVTDQTQITLELEPLPPEPDEELPTEEFEKVVSFSDIKFGNFIYVSSDENIKGKTEIIATKIQISEQLP